MRPARDFRLPGVDHASGRSTVWNRRATAAAVALQTLMPATAATVDDLSADLHGYLRQYVGVNLQDHPEPGANGKSIGGAGQLSMLRSVVKLDGDLTVGAVRFKGRFQI